MKKVVLKKEDKKTLGRRRRTGKRHRKIAKKTSPECAKQLPKKK